MVIAPHVDIESKYMPLSKGTKLGDFELVMRVGRGGMASVWVARERDPDTSAERLVAVKAMLPDLAGESEYIHMFLDEVRLVRAIKHPNVVDVYEVGEQDGVMWMAMEWVDGDSLHGVFSEASKRNPIPREIAVRIIADAAAGLHAAHELRDRSGQKLNLVHRDVSPHNILINRSGQVKLVDFGVAKAIDRISEKTRTGHLKGKFAYMSPEQVRGRRIDRKSDIFSLGIVLYELSTGQRLFRGKNEVQTLQLVNAGVITPPTKLDASYPPELERIVMKALERKPENRHPTAAAFESELREFLSRERILVPDSGVASLLKRVMNQRLEQRRIAVKQALKVLERSEKTTERDMTAFDQELTPPSTPSGAHEEPSVSNISNVSSLSQVSPLTRTSRPEAFKTRRAPTLVFMAVALVAGYVLYMTLQKANLLPKAASFRDAGPPTESVLYSAKHSPNRHQEQAQSTTPAASAQAPTASAPTPAVPAAAPSLSGGASIPRIKIEELELETEVQESSAKNSPQSSGP